MIFLALFLIWLSWAIGDTVKCSRVPAKRRVVYRWRISAVFNGRRTEWRLVDGKGTLILPALTEDEKQFPWEVKWSEEPIWDLPIQP